MNASRPIALALPLDHETPDIIGAAAELGRRLDAPVAAIHALPRRTLESGRSLDVRVAEARRHVEAHLAPLREAGVEVEEVLVEVGHPADVVLAKAPLLGAQLIVTGGGRPATVRRWIVGSVAEAVVRRSSVPVWVARGEPPRAGRVLCPVDMSPESKLGVEAALRMARAFRLPLALMTVIPRDDTTLAEGHDAPHVAREEAVARAQAEALLGEVDVDGVTTSVEVAAGDPADCIVAAAADASLLVIGSRGYDPLVRAWVGPVTARALRHSSCSALMLRHVGEGHDERAQAIHRLAEVYDRGRALLEDGRGEEALPLLEQAAEQAPTNAAVQETFAAALDRVGRVAEARSRRELAATIRRRLR